MAKPGLRKESIVRDACFAVALGSMGPKALDLPSEARITPQIRTTVLVFALPGRTDPMRFSLYPVAWCLRLVVRSASAPCWLVGVLLIVLLVASGSAAAVAADEDGEDKHLPETNAGTYSMKRDVEGETFILEAGAKLYSDNCAVCHGERLEGAALGPPLMGGELVYGASTDELVASISNGFLKRGMPAWSDTMSAEQIKTLAIWIVETREGLLYSDFNFTDELILPAGTIRTQAYDLKIDVLTTGIDPLPYSLALLPDGQVLVTEKMSGLRLITPGGELSAPIQGTPEVYDDGQLGLGGVEEGLGWLLDVAPHPRYLENGWIYLAYTERCMSCNEASRVSGRPVSMVKLVRGRIENALWVDEQVIWQPPLESYSASSDMIAGGRIAFDPDGYVFVSVGYKSGDGIQDLASPHGKIHRFRDDGRVPEDNPFVDVPGASRSAWTYGHRTPQGLEFDARTRRLWGTEHGPRGGDEVNLLLPGRNYGWPLFSKGQNYDGTVVNGDGRHGTEVSLEDIEQPVVDLTPSVAISAFVVYEGNDFAAWRGDLLVGSLKAADLIRLRIEDGQLVEREILIENLARIRDVEIGLAGELYLLLEHASGGQVVRVSAISNSLH